jgi:hypothetical protein
VVCVFVTTSTDGVETHLLAIRYPYVTVGVLLSTSGLANPVIFLSLLKMTGGATLTVGFLPMQLLVWLGGFRSQGVVAGTYQILDFSLAHYPRRNRFISIPIPVPFLWWLCAARLSIRDTPVIWDPASNAGSTYLTVDVSGSCVCLGQALGLVELIPWLVSCVCSM